MINIPCFKGEAFVSQMTIRLRFDVNTHGMSSVSSPTMTMCNAVSGQYDLRGL